MCRKIDLILGIAHTVSNWIGVKTFASDVTDEHMLPLNSFYRPSILSYYIQEILVVLGNIFGSL